MKPGYTNIMPCASKCSADERLNGESHLEGRVKLYGKKKATKKFPTMGKNVEDGS